MSIIDFQIAVHYHNDMRSTTHHEKGFSLIAVLLVIVVLAVIGVAGYFVAKHVDKKNTTISSTSTPRQYTIKIQPLGIELVVPNSINDLVYKTDTTNSTATSTHVLMSTQSLTDAAANCGVNGNPAGFGSLVKTTGQYQSSNRDRNATPLPLVKQLPSFYITLINPQTACTSNPNVLTLLNSKFAAYKAVLANSSDVQLLQ
jgi:Tfp pilus assembly major pilin PilA